MTNEDSTPTPWELHVSFPPAGDMRVYDLAQLLYTGIPHHPAHPPYSFTLTKKHGDILYPGGISGAAEMITTGGHVGTHVDGFAHVAKLGKLYGGEDITDKQTYAEGMEVHSVHEMAPLLGEGHLLDMPTLLGRALTPEDSLEPEHLAEWFKQHGPEPTEGSIVLVRTGWDSRWDNPRSFLGIEDGAPGVGLGAAKWLSERGIRASGCDTVAFEHMPNPSLDVHVHFLVENGISIMEAMNLQPLVAAQAWNFFFMAAPLRIRGGTGSPIRPLAFVSADD